MTVEAMEASCRIRDTPKSALKQQIHSEQDVGSNNIIIGKTATLSIYNNLTCQLYHSRPCRCFVDKYVGCL